MASLASVAIFDRVGPTKATGGVGVGVGFMTGAADVAEGRTPRRRVHLAANAEGSRREVDRERSASFVRDEMPHARVPRAARRGLTRGVRGARRSAPRDRAR